MSSPSDISSVTNFIPTPNEGFTTTVAAPGVTSAGTTVPLASVTGLTNGTIFVGIVEPGLTNEQTFTGTVDTAGSQITGVKWTRGTNAAHAAGVTVVDYVTGTTIKMLAHAVAVSLDQDGTLKAGAVDNAAALASNVVTTAKILDSNVTTAKIADAAVTSAKVSGLDRSLLTTDSNPYKFSAYRNGAWSVATGFAKVAFDTETYDTNNNFNAVTNNRYVAPVNGFYHFSSTVNFTPTSGDSYAVVLYKNGTIVKNGTSFVIGTTFSSTFVVTADLQLTATDYVEVFTYNGSGTTKTGGTGAPYTYFDGHLISRT